MYRGLFIVCAVWIFLLAPLPKAEAFENRVLILYDNGRTDGSLDFEAHQNVLISLIGHFNLPVRRKPVHLYQKGDIANHRATFYIGNVSGHKLPETFLRDVLYSKRPVTWINFNLAQLALSKKYQKQFEKRFGIRYLGPMHENSYELVKFRNRYFRRQLTRIGKTKVLDDKKAKVMGLAITPDRAEFFPYIVSKPGNFTYVADNPMEGAYYDDQAYIVFAETLHTLLNIKHTSQRRALIRLEDITPNSDPAKLKAIGDYLYGRGVPFGISVVPRFTDPRGAYGAPKTVDLDQAPKMANTLKYLQRRGGTVLMHGFTHQYRSALNPRDGASTDDYEFYIDKLINGVPTELSPVPEDSTAWVEGRLNQGFAILSRAGFARPRIWVTPHYGASELDYRIFTKHFAALNERPHLGVYFPYLIRKSYYGGKIIPENLGFINPQTRPPSTVVSLARKNSVVRDGFASFYVHPRLVNTNDVGTAVTKIRSLGYKFVDIKGL